MGDAGVGKTTAVRAYAERYGGDGVILVTANSVYSTRALLVDLAAELGIEYSRYRLSGDILKGIMDRAPEQIIVDEADQLRTRALEVLRTIYDKTGCSIVMVGLPRLLLYLVRGAELKENLAQLYSRVGLKLDSVPLLNLEELKAVCKDQGITNQSAQQEIFRQSGGNFRKVQKLVKRIVRMCELNKMSPEKVRKEDVFAFSPLIVGSKVVTRWTAYCWVTSRGRRTLSTLTMLPERCH